jgi:ABC-type multidrug transport system fused ATPase/permease subunit
MADNKLQNALEEILEGVHDQREKLTDAVHNLKQALSELKFQRVVRGVYNAILSGMDIFILTPVRCIQAATRTGQGIYAFLLNPLVLYLTFGLAGVFALFLVMAEFYKLWRDRKYSDPTYICSRLIPNASELETPILQQEVQNYLAKHREELKGVIAQVAPDYELDYVGNVKIAYLQLKRKSAPEQKTENKKTYPETSLDKLAAIGAKFRQSRIGKIFWPFWKALQLYSYGYWVVFALALFCGYFAATGVAFSLGIAFGVPAVIPALYLLFRTFRGIWRLYSGTKTDKEVQEQKQQLDEKVALKTAKLNVVKAFVLRKLGEAEVRDFDKKVALLLRREAANRNLVLDEKRRTLEQQLSNRNNFDFSHKRYSQNDVNERKAEIAKNLKGSETTRKWLGGFFNFANGYMFGFFAMWPVLDLICVLATGATIFILPAPIMWGLFAFYVTVGVIYAVHGVYKARKEYREHEEKVDKVSVDDNNGSPSKLEQIAYLQLKLKNLKARYKQLREKFLRKGKVLPELYLPKHKDMDCIKRTSHRHHPITLLELAGDFLKFALQQGGAGAFLIRSILTLGPILLFIGPDAVLFFGSLTLALCIAVAALSWTAIKFFEYYKTQEYARKREFIDNLDISKDMLIQEIVLLETENERLEPLERNLPAPIKENNYRIFNLFGAKTSASPAMSASTEGGEIQPLADRGFQALA